MIHMIENSQYSLSIVISTFNRKKYVDQLLSSINEQTFLPNEIIIVDSSNENISYDYPAGLNISKVYSKVAQLTHQRNLGVKNTKCDLILHIDDDVILESNYIENILDTFDKYNEIDVVGGYILNEWDETNYRNNKVVRLLNYLGFSSDSLLPGSVSDAGIFIELNGLKKNIGIYKTDFISGTSFAVRSRVYKKYNHPENINKYGGEDKVFSRMISKNFQMVINTNARLKHLFAQSGNRDSDYTSYKNTVRFNIYIQKNFPKVHSSTVVLRVYYFLLGIDLIASGILGFFLLVNTKININRILRGIGYSSGSFSIN